MYLVEGVMVMSLVVGVGLPLWVLRDKMARMVWKRLGGGVLILGMTFFCAGGLYVRAPFVAMACLGVGVLTMSLCTLLAAGYLGRARGSGCIQPPPAIGPSSPPVDAEGSPLGWADLSGGDGDDRAQRIRQFIDEIDTVVLALKMRIGIAAGAQCGRHNS